MTNTTKSQSIVIQQRAATLERKLREENDLQQVYESRMRLQDKEKADQELGNIKQKQSLKLEIAKEQRAQMRFKRSLLEKEMALDGELQTKLRQQDQKDKTQDR